MSKKHHGGPGSVPAGNLPKAGVGFTPDNEVVQPDGIQEGGGAPAQEQDPKRRLGDFTGTGEHSIQQPGGKNDANH